MTGWELKKACLASSSETVGGSQRIISPLVSGMLIPLMSCIIMLMLNYQLSKVNLFSSFFSPLQIVYWSTASFLM